MSPLGGFLSNTPEDKKLDALGDLVARLEERIKDISRRIDEMAGHVSALDGRYAGRSEFASNRRMIIIAMVFSILAFGLSIVNSTLIMAIVLTHFFA